MRHRRFILASLALLLVGFAAPLRAETPIFYSSGKVAINGYDPVAYFTAARPVRGRPDIAVMWKGVIWRFSNQANRDVFEADPWAYAPQYGGYCAYGVSMGYRDTSEPEAWQIVDGKLYLVHTTDLRSVWQRNLGRHISSADENWPDILSH